MPTLLRHASVIRDAVAAVPVLPLTRVVARVSAPSPCKVQTAIHCALGEVVVEPAPNEPHCCTQHCNHAERPSIVVEVPSTIPELNSLVSAEAAPDTVTAAKPDLRLSPSLPRRGAGAMLAAVRSGNAAAIFTAHASGYDTAEIDAVSVARVCANDARPRFHACFNAAH